jgi:hypothetical protein
MAHKKKNRVHPRDTNQVHDTSGEAQNVYPRPKDGDELPGNKKNVHQATEKANQGDRQGRSR